MTPAPLPRRTELIDEFHRVMPQVKHRFGMLIPPDLQAELAHITSHQVEALRCLSEAEGATMNDLARSQHCALSSATALADRLLKQGLVERHPDPRDRRVVRLVATTHGRQMFESYSAARREGSRVAFEALSDQEIETLVGLLRKLAMPDAQGGDGR